MATNPIIIKKINPKESIKEFVSSYWCFENPSDRNYEVVVIPDASFDLLIIQKKDKPLKVYLMGISTTFDQSVFEAHTRAIIINFKLLAAEYLLKTSVAKLVDRQEELPNDFWNIKDLNFNSFTESCNQINEYIIKQILHDIDPRKLKLANLIYSTNGQMKVKELSESVYWSSRQINRYFTAYFGLPLKRFCMILRFRASLKQINEGKLFPEFSYSDQPHFEREAKKLSGANLKTLFNGRNDRFIQVSLLGKS